MSDFDIFDRAPTSEPFLHDVEGCPFDLHWYSDKKLGWPPLKEPDLTAIYDDDYFNNYLEYETSPIAHDLIRNRCDFVRKHTLIEPKYIVDVGAASCQFVKAMGCKGYDVMPPAVDRLNHLNVYKDIYACKSKVGVFWDSLEHIPTYWDAVNQFTEWVFISTPIYIGPYDILSSKHFKPNEHIWYFTQSGLVEEMAKLGWELMEANDRVEIGRYSIISYAFKRVK